MNTATKKNKGRKLQKDVANLIIAYFPLLQKDDVVSKPMGSPGEDIMLSSQARQAVHNISIECKNNETWSGLYKAYNQAEHNTPEGGIPVVALKMNHESPLVVLDIEDFLEILAKLYKYKSQEDGVYQ